MENFGGGKAQGVASLSARDLPDPYYDFLDIPSNDEGDPTNFKKPTKKGASVLESEHILGTLVVRVVAARDLQPIQTGGLSLLKSNRASRGSANPYASVKFGGSTQRSSEVFDNLDPIWPRQETMFMDVSLPETKLKHPDLKDPLAASAATTDTNDASEIYEQPSAILTVAMFHSPEVGRGSKFPNKGGMMSGDSDDIFLGMASVDLTGILTGKDDTFDKWLPLSGVTDGFKGSVRIVCEYESNDIPPRKGDYCRFTRFCHPRDLYPLEPGRQYRVAEVDGDAILLSYKSQEGWICSFQAHRNMLVCEERHQGAVDLAQDEIVSIAERLNHAPLVHSVQETVERIAVDGLLNVGEELVQGGLSLFSRWMGGGVNTIVEDLTEATNWDGRHTPDGLDIPDFADSSPAASSHEEDFQSTTSEPQESDEKPEALPNMPCCPITGEPMVEPVVAADGHTYERSAIARWLATSDTSPLTGGILSHKELVPNYGLMSSVEASSRKNDVDSDFDGEQSSD